MIDSNVLEGEKQIIKGRHIVQRPLSHVVCYSQDTGTIVGGKAPEYMLYVSCLDHSQHVPH